MFPAHALCLAISFWAAITSTSLVQVSNNYDGFQITTNPDGTETIIRTDFSQGRMIINHHTPNEIEIQKPIGAEILISRSDNTTVVIGDEGGLKNLFMRELDAKTPITEGENMFIYFPLIYDQDAGLPHSYLHDSKEAYLRNKDYGSGDFAILRLEYSQHKKVDNAPRIEIINDPQLDPKKHLKFEFKEPFTNLKEEAVLNANDLPEFKRLLDKSEISYSLEGMRASAKINQGFVELEFEQGAVIFVVRKSEKVEHEDGEIEHAFMKAYGGSLGRNKNLGVMKIELKVEHQDQIVILFPKEEKFENDLATTIFAIINGSLNMEYCDTFSQMMEEIAIKELGKYFDYYVAQIIGEEVQEPKKNNIYITIDSSDEEVPDFNEIDNDEQVPDFNEIDNDEQDPQNAQNVHNGPLSEEDLFIALANKYKTIFIEANNYHVLSLEARLTMMKVRFIVWLRREAKRKQASLELVEELTEQKTVEFLRKVYALDNFDPANPDLDAILSALLWH